MNNYFKGCDAELKSEAGSVRCFLPKGHVGPHEGVEGCCQWVGTDHKFQPASNLFGCGFIKETIEAQESRNAVLNTVRETQWEPLPSTLQLWRIQERIEAHMSKAPEREAKALFYWASGFADGMDRALLIMKREESR